MSAKIIQPACSSHRSFTILDTRAPHFGHPATSFWTTGLYNSFMGLMGPIGPMGLMGVLDFSPVRFARRVRILDILDSPVQNPFNYRDTKAQRKLFLNLSFHILDTCYPHFGQSLCRMLSDVALSLRERSFDPPSGTDGSTTNPILDTVLPHFGHPVCILFHGAYGAYRSYGAYGCPGFLPSPFCPFFPLQSPILDTIFVSRQFDALLLN